MKEETKEATSTKSTPPVEASEAAYTKEQFLGSAKYSYQDKDVLAALLEDGKTYSVTEAKQMIDDFKNKEAE